MIDDGLHEELSALLDGALPDVRAKELRERIGKDPELRRAYEELERAVRAVRALPRPRAPAELRARIRGSLGGRRAGARFFRLPVLAAAATVLLAAGLAFYLRPATPVRHEAAERPSRTRLGDELGKQQAAEAPAAAAERAQAKEDMKKLGARDDAPGVETQLGAPKDAAKRGAARAKAETDLLGAVARSREIAAADRKAYLREVVALGAEETAEHLRAVFPDGPEARGEADALFDRWSAAVLATIQLEDREEANLVKRILDAAPRPAEQAAALAVEQEEKDHLTAQVQGTPDDLRRLGKWLALLDLSAPAASKPKVQVFEEAKSEKGAPPKVRTAVVRLRFAKPPEPEPQPKGK